MDSKVNIPKISPVIITFLKYKLERWHTNLKLINEEICLKLKI